MKIEKTNLNNINILNEPVNEQNSNNEVTQTVYYNSVFDIPEREYNPTILDAPKKLRPKSLDEEPVLHSLIPPFSEDNRREEQTPPHSPVASPQFVYNTPERVQEELNSEENEVVLDENLESSRIKRDRG